MHGEEKGIPATFSVIFLVRLVAQIVGERPADQTTSPQQMGWKPAPSQPKPAARGSGKVSLKDVL